MGLPVGSKSYIGRQEGRGESNEGQKGVSGSPE